MGKNMIKKLMIAFCLMIGLIPGVAGALEGPQSPPPGVPGGPPPPPPGIPGGSARTLCEENFKAKEACQKANNYCQAAQQDWADSKLIKNNLAHCAYHVKQCYLHVHGDSDGDTNLRDVIEN